MQSQKNPAWSLLISKAPFSITVIQVHAPATNAKEAEPEKFYKNLQDFLELTPKKWCSFHHRGLECRNRKSRDTWVTGKFAHGVQNETGQRLTEFCHENALVIANTFFQHKDDSTRRPHQMINTKIRLIIFFATKDWRSSIQWAKTRLGAEWLRSWTLYCQIQA